MSALAGPPLTEPSWDIVTTRDLNIPAAVQRYMATRAHAHTTEVAASHAVAVSRPRLVTDVIEQAARATTPDTPTPQDGRGLGVVALRVAAAHAPVGSDNAGWS